MYVGIDTTFCSARFTACYVDDPALVCTPSDHVLWSIHSAPCSVPDSANLGPATVVLLLLIRLIVVAIGYCACM